MCGRAACTLCPDDIQKACGYKAPNSGKKFQKPKWNEGNGYNQYKPSHNIAPTEVLPVLVSGSQVNDESERVIQPMIWGMIPPWHKGDPKTHGLTTHNCRLEHMLSSKLYSPPFSKGLRCVVVCDGFYEWQTTKGSKNKQPYFIYRPQPEGVEIESATTWTTDWSDSEGWKGPQLLKMAGLFQIFKTTDGEEIYSCTVITMESNETLSWLHHRTPAVLESDEQVSDWLDAGNVPSKKALDLITPPKTLSWHPVSTLVNNSRNKDEECNKRISLSTPPVKRSASGCFMDSWLKKGSPAKKSTDDISQDEKRAKH
ncbi:Embryonic stem cell-specific 5-hydroxymethylcytosine-binding protein [Gryllus bimaculatus]|nr:Embryonic stem cell-specific 5-hydroxymethylcytosine-binding protein [Gryllus bimaculatus]